MIKKLNILISSILLSSSLYAIETTGSCWDANQKAELEYAELEQSIKFSFKDAKSCEPISNASVYFSGINFKTDRFGEITVPIPPESLDLELPLVVKKNGYITLKQKVTAQIGSFWQNKFLVTKELPITSARFILSWDATPKDLDLHLKSDDFHISFRNKNGASFKAKLDRDSMKGYGPETITLNKLNKNKSYKVYVYKYSSDGELNHNINFSLYKNNELHRVITIPDNMPKNSRCVQLATIHDNKVIYDIKAVSKSYCKK